jgi:asparagine synthase (glutamine-hydrolysing)
MLSGAARASGCRAIIAGEGADELFGGYPGYGVDATAAARPSSAGLLEAELEREIRERMWGADVFYEQDQLPLRSVRESLYSEELLDRLDEFQVTNQRLVEPGRLAGRHPLHQRSYLDFTLRLADHLLGDHGDRMAMANSVEARYPYLDLELVDYMRGVPPACVLRGGEQKAVLKTAAADLVPDEILRRRKFGFRAPASPALLRLGAPGFDELISRETVERQGYFNPETVAALAGRQRSGKGDLNPHLESDWLMLVATFSLLVDEFRLPCLGGARP